MKRNISRFLIPLFIVIVAAVVVMAQAGKPAVEVKTQSVAGGTVTIDRIVSNGPGWINIHLDKNGSPGDSIGHAQVASGENRNIQVKIDVTKLTTKKLWAMLHTDAGKIGVWEYPGPDVPVTYDGNVVMTAFTVR